MEFEVQKQHWLKLKEEYRRKNELIRELEELERHPDLASVIDRKRRLDHELDALEHIELEDLTRLQTLFVQEVANTRPDLSAVLQQLLSACDESIKQQKQIRVWIEFYETLLPHLAQIIYLRRNSSGLGMIKYLFGQRPTTLITDEIHKVKALLTKEIKEYDNPLFSKLFDLVRERWSFQQIDREYAPIFTRLEQQYKQLIESEMIAIETHTNAETNLFNWIETVE